MRFSQLQETKFSQLSLTMMLDLYESRLKDRPTFQDWERNTGLHPAVLTAYCVLGDEQRDAPEIAMVAAQHHLGGGVLDVCIEHVGDLSNRMSPLHPYSWAQDETMKKIERCLRYLESGYGFDRERKENWKVASSYSKNPDAWYSKAYQLLETYERAHMALPFEVSQVHKEAVYAAATLGDKKHLDDGDVGRTAAVWLRSLARKLDSIEGWTVSMQGYNPALNKTIDAWDKKTGKVQAAPEKDVHNPETEDVLAQLLKSYEKV
jgi:hypothetical protein